MNSAPNIYQAIGLIKGLVNFSSSGYTITTSSGHIYSLIVRHKIALKIRVGEERLLKVYPDIQSKYL
jgi:hypothetical protein